MDLLDSLAPLLSLLTRSCAQDRCVTQMEQHFYDACMLLGFAHAHLSVISDRAAATSPTRNDADSQQPVTATESLLFSINFDNFPPAFMARYDDGQYWRVDTLLQLVQQKMQSTFFTFWHATAQHGGAAQQHAAISDLASTFAIGSGVLLSYWNGSRQLVISLGSYETSEALAQRVELQSLQQRIMALALALSAMLDKISQCNTCVLRARKPKLADFALTRMQRAILLAYLQDPNASLASISESQGISGETVKYHLKCIREKLDMPGASGHVLAHKARHVSLL